MSDDWTQVPPGVTLSGTVSYDFAGDGPYQLPLRVGETVIVMFESTNGWLKGYVLGREDKRGIFPTNFVQLSDYRPKFHAVILRSFQLLVLTTFCRESFALKMSRPISVEQPVLFATFLRPQLWLTRVA